MRDPAFPAFHYFATILLILGMVALLGYETSQRQRRSDLQRCLRNRSYYVGTTPAQSMSMLAQCLDDIQGR